MRIAFTFLTYGKDIFGGIENALFNLTKGLTELGHEVFVFTSSAYATNEDPRFPTKVFVSDHLPAKYDGHVSNLINVLKSNAHDINSDFDKFISKYDPEVVVVVDPIWGVLQLTSYVSRADIPLVLSHHVSNKWPETAGIMQESFSFPYKIHFSVSDFLTQDIKSTFDTKGIEIAVLPNSVDCALYIESSKIARQNYIFCNSRIARGKNVDILVKAFKKVSDSFDVGLKICSGTFPFAETSQDVKDVQDLIKTLGLTEKVELLPFLKWEEIPAITMQSKLVVLPSSYETFGIAALETSIAGVPLITADTSNLKNLVKDSALLFDPENVTDLEDKMIAVLSDYDSYKSKAMTAVKSFRKYCNKEVAGKLVDEIYNHNLL